MSNKPNFRRKEYDVLVNYKIVKTVEEEINVGAVLRVPYKWVAKEPVRFHITPTMYEGVVLFSLVGLPTDQRRVQRYIQEDVEKHNCALRCSANLKAPKRVK